MASFLLGVVLGAAAVLGAMFHEQVLALMIAIVTRIKGKA